VLAIVVILAGLLLPVMVSAKASAAKAACVSNFRQAFSAMSLYMDDYDGRFVPVNYQPGEQANPQNDRTWVQLLLPYAKSISIFHCPADYGNRDKGPGSFDEDLVPSDTYARYYTSSLRSDVGYNYLYLSPVLQVGSKWQAFPRNESDVIDPSKTILFVDSVWSRDESGNPYGGGSWLVVPPCRFELREGEAVDTFTKGREGQVYTAMKGWNTSAEDSSLLYGRAWPWHYGRMNVARVDGSIRTMSPVQLTDGCDAKPEWHGYISNSSKYMWALN
jgi:prepilin-type processing-associated H-X9-DG protein